MAITYSTHEIHPRDRVAYWIEVATRAYFKHEFRSSSGAAYLASIRSGALGGLGVSSLECNPCEVRRTAQDAACADCDDFLLGVPLAGRLAYAQDGRHAIGERGSLVLTDARRPYTVDISAPTSCITIKIPRGALEARLGNAASLTARTMAGHNPVVGLASGFLALLPAHLEGLEAAAASKIAEQAVDLVALALSVEIDTNGLTLSSPRAVALLRLKAAIESRLSDPDLKPASAAAAAGISVRYANALLSAEATSVERYILKRRLERSRRALEDPAQAHRTIGDIAFSWGFSDLSHFGRRFKAEFGCSPRDYRYQLT